MYESFKIKNFRCFEDFEINNLSRVNLIAGKNNSGKTALLEAIFLHSGRANPDLMMNINHFRNLKMDEGNTEDRLGWLFYNNIISKKIEISSSNEKSTYSIGTCTNGKDQDITGSVVKLSNLAIFSSFNDETTSELSVKNGKFHWEIKNNKSEHDQFRKNIHFLPRNYDKTISSILNNFKEIYRLKKESKIVQVLNILEPKLEKLSLSGEEVVCDIKGLEHRIPITLMGDGVYKLFLYMTTIYSSNQGVLLLDEVDNGLHYSVLTNIWESIDTASKETNTQVFATTHSYECIKSAYEVFGNSEDFSLFKLYKNKLGEIEPVFYDKKMLNLAMEENLELR